MSIKIKFLALLCAVSVLAGIASARPIRSDIAGNRCGMDGETPSAYFVEYLESSGTPYIVVDGFQDGIDIVLSHLPRNDSYVFCGAWNEGSRMNGIRYTPLNQRGWVVASENINNIYSMNLDNKTPIRIIVDGKNVLVGEQTFSFRGWYRYNANFDRFALFGCIGNNQRVSTYAGRIYSCRLYSGGAMTHDFVPIRFLNEDGEWEGALYDFVSGELFRNQGTGAFSYGQDLEVLNI